MAEDKKICKCAHHKVVPVCIALIGLAVLLMKLDVYASVMGLVWPALLVVIGGAKMVECNCC